MRFDYQPALASVPTYRGGRQAKKLLAAVVGAMIFILIIYSCKNYAPYYHVAEETNQSPERENATKQESISTELADLKQGFKEPRKSQAPDQQVNNLPKNTEKWLSLKTKVGDSLSHLIANGSPNASNLKEVVHFIRNNPGAKSIARLKDGQKLNILLDEFGAIKKIHVILSVHKSCYVEVLGANQFKIHNEEKPITKKLRLVSGKVNNSFFASARAAGLNEQLSIQVAEIFGWDLDFGADLRPQDRFKVLYEEKFIGNEKIGIGQVIAAELINRGQIRHAVRFEDQRGKVGYYSPEGYNLHKTFLRNPVKFIRIGSRFSDERHHPILHKIRAHRGVDYVAPAGTPVRAVGDGRVVSVGRKGGYGNVVELQHGAKYSTLYAHLSGFANGIRKDTLVKQGQVIGYVGKTGLATGDHLHYEFRIHGVHRDPLTVQLPRSNILHDKAKAKFLLHAQQMLHLLHGHDQTQKIINPGKSLAHNLSKRLTKPNDNPLLADRQNKT